MKLIVGLGNPGLKYQNTRHNCGFIVMDEIEKKLNIRISQEKFKALITIERFNNNQVIFMKPMTYMNLSGEALIQAVQFYKIKNEDILIIHDDLDLKLGQVRIRSKGSSAGQNGLKSIFNLLNTQEIPRIRIGIGKDPVIPVKDYVLQKIPSDQKEVFDKSIEIARDAAIAFIDTPIEKVMNQYNKNDR